MRGVQVSIDVVLPRHKSDVPELPCLSFRTYADSENGYEALSAAFYDALTKMQRLQKLPDKGTRNTLTGKDIADIKNITNVWKHVEKEKK